MLYMKIDCRYSGIRRNGCMGNTCTDLQVFFQKEENTIEICDQE